jgi:hypothetical protein
MNNNDKQASDGEAKAKPEVIKLGLDLHARQVTECRQLDGSTPKPAQKWDLWKLLDKVEEVRSIGVASKDSRKAYCDIRVLCPGMLLFAKNFGVWGLVVGSNPT